MLAGWRWGAIGANAGVAQNAIVNADYGRPLVENADRAAAFGAAGGALFEPAMRGMGAADDAIAAAMSKGGKPPTPSPGGQSAQVAGEVVAAQVQAEAPTVTATFSIGGQTFRDVNPLARTVRTEGPTIPGLRAPNANQLTMHAEIGVMMQAKQAGVTGGHGTLTIQGKPAWCYCAGDVKTFARYLDLESLTVMNENKMTSFSLAQLSKVKEGGRSLQKPDPQ